MKKFSWFLIFLNIIYLLSCSKPDEIVLFPEREAINKQSEVFFREISVGLPQLKTIPFFIKSKNYFSAYIKLSRVLYKTPFFKNIFYYFKENHDELIEKFNLIKDKIELNNYKFLFKTAELNEFEGLTLILYRLLDDYNNSILSGNIAYRSWNIILDITNNAIENIKFDWKTYGIVKIASKIFFYRKKEIYKKRVKYLENKIKNKKPESNLLNYILQTN